MSDYLPRAYRDFRTTYPEVAESLDRVGRAIDAAGPLDERTRRLVHLGIAIGALAEGAVRSTRSARCRCSRSPRAGSRRRSQAWDGRRKCSRQRERPLHLYASALRQRDVSCGCATASA
jgi:hypothetical protein